MGHHYSFGIEEEYFVIDLASRNVRAAMPQKFFRACKRELRENVTNELLQSQIEVTTRPCCSFDDARDQIRNVRSVLVTQAARFNLGIVAAATHPLAVWREQKQTPKDRYSKVMDDIQMLGLRNMLCGMHVHVEVPDPARRIELMYRTVPYLPVLLALSVSSPFWQGRRTGLQGYRLAAYDELPRTGIPPLFTTTEAYDAYVQSLVNASIIPDASYIWWAIRPSLRHPTLELRIADVCTHIEDGLCIAALFRCLVRHLVRHEEVHAELGVIDYAVARENKWRAQRYGDQASFVDPLSRSARPLSAIVDDFLSLLKDDADALGCQSELDHARTIVHRGTSAGTQLAIYAEARETGATRTDALRNVVDWLDRTTMQIS